MSKNVIAVASDHAGFDLKEEIRTFLIKQGFDVLDLGPTTTDSVDYPDYGYRMARSLASTQSQKGILVCGSGIGISIAANRHEQVRAALCHDVTTAKLARLHNDANVLAVGARTTGGVVALEMVQAFLETDFEGGRHQRRVDQLSDPQLTDPA